MLVDKSLELGSVALDMEENGPGLAYPLMATFVATASASAVTFKVQHCDTAGGTYADFAAYGPMAVVEGKAYQFALPPGYKRYLKCPTTGGKAFLTIGRQAWEAAKQAESVSGAFVTEQ